MKKSGNLSYAPHIYTYMYMYIYISSYHTASMDLPDPLSPPISIVHRSWKVFQATSCIGALVYRF